MSCDNEKWKHGLIHTHPSTFILQELNFPAPYLATMILSFQQSLCSWAQSITGLNTYLKCFDGLRLKINNDENTLGLVCLCFSY